MSSTTAAGRTSARRTVMDPPPGPRPRRPRLLLLGLPMFAVFAAFGAIWLALGLYVAALARNARASVTVPE